MVVLVTGASGFVGTHLCRELSASCRVVPLSSTCDVRDFDGLCREIEAIQPAAVIHLAAVSHVPTCELNPADAWAVNVGGTQFLMDACRKIVPKSRFLLVSSGEVYGRKSLLDKGFSEADDVCPTTFYAKTKWAAEQVVLQYSKAYDMDALVLRPFNHIGPGQVKGFVVPDFCSQIAAIEQELQEPCVRVGNLQSYRDFLDVRDVVRAYRLALEKGRSGAVYNVASGAPVLLQDLLQTLLNCSTKKIRVESRQDDLRKDAANPLYGDASLLEQETGWTLQYSLQASLEDCLNEWRAMLCEANR